MLRSRTGLKMSQKADSAKEKKKGSEDLQTEEEAWRIVAQDQFKND